MTPTSKAHTPDFVSPVSSHGPALSAPSVPAPWHSDGDEVFALGADGHRIHIAKVGNLARTVGEEEAAHIAECVNGYASLAARNAELEAALRAIIDFRAEYDGTLPEHPEDCPDCARWKGHPIQRGICDARYRQLYARDAKNDHADNTQHIRMRDIARAALNLNK